MFNFNGLKSGMLGVAVACAVVFGVVGCKKPKAHEATMTAEELSALRKQRAADQATKAKAAQAAQTQTPKSDATPEPPPATDLSGAPIPIVIDAAKMTSPDGANARVDAQGGRLMTQSGRLMMEGVRVPYQPRSITMELRADVAYGVGPKFALMLVNPVSRNSAFPWGTDDAECTSTAYERVSKYWQETFKGDFVPDTYTVVLDYKNNSEGIPEGSKEDRNLYLKSIEFHP